MEMYCEGLEAATKTRPRYLAIPSRVRVNDSGTPHCPSEGSDVTSPSSFSSFASQVMSFLTTSPEKSLDPNQLEALGAADGKGIFETQSVSDSASASSEPSFERPEERTSKLVFPVDNSITIENAHAHGVSCAVSSSCGRYIFSCGGDKFVRRWCQQSGASRGAIETAHAMGVQRLVLAADGARLFVSGEDLTVTTIRTDTFRLEHHYVSQAFPTTCLDVSPNGTWFVSSSIEGCVRLINVATPDVTFSCVAPETMSLLCAKFTTESTFVGGNAAGDVYEFALQKSLSVQRKLLSHEASVFSLCIGAEVKGDMAWYSGDRWLFTSSPEHVTKSHASGVPHLTIGEDPTSAHSDSIFSICVLHGKVLCTGSMDKTVRLWDTENGSCLVVLEGHKKQVNSVSTTPQGGLLSASQDGSIILWG